MSDKCDCCLCVPQPGTRPHPEYGYDMNKVSGVECIVCEKPIGDEPYDEHLTWARFGQMQFIHRRCWSSEKEREQHFKRFKKNWLKAGASTS